VSAATCVDAVRSAAGRTLAAVTRVLTVDPADPDADAVATAAAALRRGALVAFPTETVYGLGAHALEPAAVRRVFAAKGRPSTDPLIVHVPSAAAARDLVSEWPEPASALADRWWPGPLTLVLPRGGAIPSEVTGGGDTVAVRVPAHGVALALLRVAAVPVAAPSANRFGRISPTTATHVMEELEGRVDVVLDGGPTPLGVESTVLAVGTRRARLLRPGGVTVEDLRRVLDELGVALEVDDRAVDAEDAPAASPGRLVGHYAPGVPAVLAESAGLAARLVAELVARGVDARPVSLPEDPSAAARVVYARLRDADTDAADRTLLVVAAVDPAGLGRAVNDRLFRAAHGRVVAEVDAAVVDRLAALVGAPPAARQS
jgi:L-threonylcarbamoyladenylate synthase